MLRSTLCAAAAAGMLAMAAPVQAMPVDSTLNASAMPTVQQAAYWDYHHRYYRHHHRWWHSYAYSPYRHRHCWSVRTWRGWERRCSW